MLAICFATAALLSHFVLAVLIPGLWLERRLFVPYPREPGGGFSSQLLRIFCLGSYVCLVAFTLALGAEWMWGAVQPRWLPLAIELAVDLSLLLDLLWRERDWLADISRRLRGALARPEVWPVVVAALGVAVWATYRCPCALDNAAIGWLSAHLDNPGLGWDHSQGSPAYIAALYLPALAVSPPIPIPTLAVAYKFPLALLVAMVCYRMVTRLELRPARPLILALFTIVATHFSGLYGLLETGKESFIALTILFLYATELLEFPHEGEGDPGPRLATMGLLVATAIGYGAIALPYAAVLSLLYMALSLGRRPVAAWAVRVIAIASLPATLTISAMMHRSLGVSTAMVVGFVALFVLVDRFGPEASEPGDWLGPLLLVLATGAVALLLPVLFDWGTPADPHPFAPLDGKTTFSGLLYHSITMKNWVVKCGLVGLLLTICSPRLRRNAGLVALSIFPFAALVPTLAAAHLVNFTLPFHPAHIWNLAKDIPNWCFGYYFGLFAILAAGHLGMRLRGRAAYAPVAVMLCALLFRSQELRMFMRVDRPSYFTATGGYDDPAMAQATDFLYRALHESPQPEHRRFLLVMEDPRNIHAVLNMYDCRCAVLGDENFGQALSNGGMRVLVVTPDVLTRFVRKTQSAPDFERELARFGSGRDGIRVLAAPPPALIQAKLRTQVQAAPAGH